MAGGGGGNEGEPEFQIAPMIDVLLVLLIFFMSIAMTAVTRYDPSIQLPVAPDAMKKETSVGELVFNIAWHAADHQAVTTYGDDVVNLDAIVPVLAAQKKADPQIRILIRSDALVPVHYVSAVVNAAAQAGITDITFATLAR